MKNLGRGLGAALFAASLLATMVMGATPASAYGHAGSLDVWQVGLSYNCTDPTVCGGGGGGFWGWVQFNRDPNTGATDADAELTGCFHAVGGGGGGAGHTSIDATGWIIKTGQLGGSGGQAVPTFWVTGGTETDSFRGQTISYPLVDEFGNPVTPSNPQDTNIPVAPGHYSTSEFLGLVEPMTAAQLQVAYKPAR